MIMRDGVTIVRERQLAIRREMDRRGIALKQVEFDSGIPYATLLSYFPAEGSREPAVMPASALYKLAEGKALPNDLLSLLLPQGLVIVSVPEGVDFDDIEDACRELLATKGAAHHPESEAGREIGPGEEAELATKVVQIRAKVAA
jgi:hypothetical protein